MKKRSNTSRYFINRGEQRMKHANDDATKVMAQINRPYSRSTSRLTKEIDNIMDSLKGLEIEDVRKMLDAPISYDRYQELLTIYKTTKNPETKKKMHQMLKASAARGRITRKEALIEAINRESAVMGGTIAERTTNHLKDTFVSAMADNSFVGVPTKVINEVLRHIWSEENYSNRIWRNTDILAYRIRDEILEGLTSGKGNKQIANNIAEYTDYGRYAAERLVRTETSYVVNSADLESAKRLGVKAVRFEATLDSRTSEICREHNQKIIPIDKVEIGVNTPPLHPYCRSFLVNIEEGWDYEGKKGLEELIDESEEINKREQKRYSDYITNEKIRTTVTPNGDLGQYLRYRDTIDSDKFNLTFEDFVYIKYNNIEEYKVVKLEYQDEKLRQNIRKKYNLNIHEGRQGKHIIEHNNYTEKSYLFDNIDPQELANKYALTGELKRVKIFGEWTKKEFILPDDHIGYYIDNKTNSKVFTKRFSFSYSKSKGIHIIPRKEEKKMTKERISELMYQSHGRRINLFFKDGEIYKDVFVDCYHQDEGEGEPEMLEIGNVLVFIDEIKNIELI